jgi:hypothetical protein
MKSLEIWSDQVTSIFLQFTSTEVISNVEFCHYFEILCKIHEIGRFVTVLLLTLQWNSFIFYDRVYANKEIRFYFFSPIKSVLHKT